MAKSTAIRAAILSKPTATGQFAPGALSNVSAQGTTKSVGAALTGHYQTVGGVTQTVIPADQARYIVAPASPALAGKIATKAVQTALKADPYAATNAFLNPDRQAYTTQIADAYGVMPGGYNQKYLSDPDNWKVAGNQLIDLGSGRSFTLPGAPGGDFGGGGGGGGYYADQQGGKDNTLLYVALVAAGIAVGKFK